MTIPWNKGTKGICKPNSGTFKKGQIPWNKGKKGLQFHTEEWKEKSKIWKLGNKSKLGQYKLNGKTPIYKKLRGSKEFKDWRTKVFERDNFTCVSCDRVGVYLEPHHLYSFTKHPEFRFEEWNGQTLCRDCHYNLHKELGFNKGGD